MPQALVLEEITGLIRNKIKESINDENAYFWIESVEIAKKTGNNAAGSIVYCYENEEKSTFYRQDWEYDGEVASLIDSPEEVTRTVVYKPVEPTRYTQLKHLEGKSENEYRVGGYAVVFGNEEQKDLEGTFFTKATDYWLKYYKTQPVIFDHAVGLALPKSVKQVTAADYIIGRVDPEATKADDIGIWMETVLEAHEKWADHVEGEQFDQAVVKMVDDGVLHYSTGSPIHLIDTKPNGEMLSWPIVELSITPTPAEPRNTKLQRVVRSHQQSGDQQTRLEPPIIVMFKGIGYEHQVIDQPGETESHDNPEIDVQITIKQLILARKRTSIMKTITNLRK